MQIAITSQNRKTITEHAGKCRNFWIYDIEQGTVAQKHLVQLPIEQSFHASHHAFAEPLAGINVLITGSLGNGLYQRLLQSGVQPIVTAETDPDAAIAAYLDNNLIKLPAIPNNHCHENGHAH